MNARNDESGFTLLELLIAMTLLALLMVLLFGGLRFGARVWERSETSSTGGDEVRLVQNLLRRELEQAYPLYLPGAETGHVDFSGDAQSLTFLAPPPQAFAAGGRARISLQKRRDGEYWQLVMVIRPELAAADTPARVEPLLSRLADVRFSYAGDSPAWQSSWRNRKTLPQLIRLEVAFPPGDARNWPALVASPRISADANCVYDAATKSCQGRP